MTDNEIYHYGVKRRSGRYPFGSGEDPYQHEESFLKRYKGYKDSRLSETEIAGMFGISTGELRQRYSNERNQQKIAENARIVELQNKGYSTTKIGEIMGMPEGTVRSRLKNMNNNRVSRSNDVAEVLRDSVAENKYIQIGEGSEMYLGMMGVSRTTMDNAVRKLIDEGYTVQNIHIKQLGSADKETTIKVLAPPGTTEKEIIKNQASISLPTKHFMDGGDILIDDARKPVSVDSKRVVIRYNEDGGVEKDGVIEIRRGVPDLNLGNSTYAQVRIGVDDSHYLKGMAIYADDLPPGIDIRFNTNKHKGVPMMSDDKENSVLKPMKFVENSNNPFGAAIRQFDYIDINGKTQQSALNIVNEEGDWGKWSKTLSSEFLSKQPYKLVENQLRKTVKDRQIEFDEIMAITNPVVKKKFLEDFAEQCDSDAVHLKSAAMPRQASYVILPVTSLKSNEIYAPNYEQGETVICIRYPHGGRFEIPELTVNNRNKEAQRVLGKNAKDAVGINPVVAGRLSGADFDGDTIVVIPNNSGNIKTSPALKGLQNFEPRELYKNPPGVTPTGKKTGFNTGREMGMITNLITDMTIKGANTDEICRAVKHSMVVIDAEKHNLDYKTSYNQNGIDELKRKYQNKGNGKYGGASTIISKASSDERVPHRKAGVYITDEKTGKTSLRYIDPDTGAKLYTTTGKTYNRQNAKGEWVKVAKTTKTTKMDLVSDAYELSSGTKIESAYAEYANQMKTMGNKARKASLNTNRLYRSPTAAKVYSSEVETINEKLTRAQANAPLERQAQLLGHQIVKAQKAANPDMTAAEISKAEGKAIHEARIRVGASKERIKLTDREVEAIQAGAIGGSKLERILANMDSEVAKNTFAPRETKGLSSSQLLLAKTLANNGATQAEIANRLGVSVSTVNEAL